MVNKFIIRTSTDGRNFTKTIVNFAYCDSVSLVGRTKLCLSAVSDCQGGDWLFLKEQEASNAQ